MEFPIFKFVPVKLRVVEAWSGVFREVMEFPSLETLKTHLNAILCNLL